MRGFRWQVLALLLAAVTFGIVFFSRQAPEELPATATPAPAATATPLPNTPTRTSTGVLLATSTPNFVAEPDAVIERIVTFREAIPGEVNRLNPLFQGTNPAEDAITHLIFEGLVQTNEYGEPIPALAESWTIANNRLEYIFRLRDDVQWQDGTPFTARDVAFTMAILRDPDFPGDDEVGKFWQTVETEVLDDYLVRFRLTQPLASFLDALRIGILPEHALRGTPAENILTHPFNLSPVGTGPYQLSALRSTDGNRIDVVDLRRAPLHRHTDRYTIERMRFQIYPTLSDAITAFNAGNADGLATPSNIDRPDLIRQTDASVHTRLEPTLGALIFNWQQPEDEDRPPNPLREERVRRALALSLDRRAIVQRNLLNRAVPAHNPLVPGLWAYDAGINFPAPDPQQALTLLADANLAQQNNEEAGDEAPLRFEVTLLTPDTPELVTLAEEVGEQWASLNIDVEVEAEPSTSYQQRLDSGDFDIALVELSLGNSADPDVYSFWHQGQYPDGNNYGAVDDRRISETLERARREPFGLNRVEHYRQFQQEFIDRAIAIPLYYPLFTYVVQDHIDGVQLGFIGQPEDRFRNLPSWRVTEQE